ncbi:MAG TPA: hypothetical protein VJ208_01800 [Candidatus Nanoarchaeia archaeon]|nr:hypothetical protein [Candidatus Nanoarchaeia archaeon]
MKKRGLALTLFLTLLLVNLVSAQFYGGVGNLLDSIDDSTIVLLAIFLIVFALVNFSISRFTKGNKAISATIAFSFALLTIWGVNRSGLGYTNLFYNLFFFLPVGFLETLWPLLLAGLWAVLIIKYHFKKGTGILLIGTGALLIFMSVTGLTYEVGTSSAIGFVLIIFGIGFWIWKSREHTRRIRDTYSPNYA